LSGLATISSKRLAQLGYFRSWAKTEKQKTKAKPKAKAATVQCLAPMETVKYIRARRYKYVYMTQSRSSLAKVAEKSPQRKKRPPDKQVNINIDIDRLIDNSAQNWSQNVRLSAKKQWIPSRQRL